MSFYFRPIWKNCSYTVSDDLLSLAVISLRIKTWLKNNDNNI